MADTGFVNPTDHSSTTAYDNWFIGFDHKIICGSYVGFDKNFDLGRLATGASVSLPIVGSFFAKAVTHNQHPIRDCVPKDIVLKKIDFDTGLFTNEDNGFVESFRIRQ